MRLSCCFLALATLLSMSPRATAAVVVTPEQFGAKGDGLSDDTTAFQLAAQAIQSAGEGVLMLKPNMTYRVGRQTHAEGTTPYWQPEQSLL